MKEKRKFRRLESKDKILLERENGRQEEDLLLDISPGGMRAKLASHIKTGSSISGQFKVLPQLGCFYVKGEVVWTKALDEKTLVPSFEAGIKFSKVSAIPL